MLQEHKIPLRIIKTRYMESNKQNELRAGVGGSRGIEHKKKKKTPQKTSWTRTAVW